MVRMAMVNLFVEEKENITHTVNSRTHTSLMFIKENLENMLDHQIDYMS